MRRPEQPLSARIDVGGDFMHQMLLGRCLSKLRPLIKFIIKGEVSWTNKSQQNDRVRNIWRTWGLILIEKLKLSRTKLEESTM